MSTNPQPDANGLPPAPTRGCPVSASMFDRLMESARKGGWPAVFVTFAQGETVSEPKATGGVYERPRRRRVLGEYLDKRPDLKTLLDNAAQERRDRLLSQLEDEVEKIALGAGDITQDFDDRGRVKRTRVDRRNKLHALLKLLASHDPDTYAERRKLDATVSGQVDHRHAHAHLNVGGVGGYLVNVEMIQSLEPADQAEFMRLLQLCEDKRRERPQHALPPGQNGEGQ